MKIKYPLLLASTLVAANGATKVTLANFAGVSAGVPIVDNAGNAISKDLATIAVGSFDSAFADTLGTLDVNTSDQAVIDAFTGTGGEGSFSLNGLFNGDITIEGDPDGSLGAAGTPLYALITYTPAGGDVQALVLGFGQAFPEQNAVGAADFSLGRNISSDDVVFGAGNVPVNLDSLPNAAFAKPEFATGISFDGSAVIPEPSTSLLAGLAGLALAVRRRR